MVNITKRMTKLRALLALRVGPSAAIFPPEVTKLHMDFAIAKNEGHEGSRHFWRFDLRRLKYYNPSIPMTVSRSKNPDDGALMTIHFTSPSSASSTQPPTSSTITPHIFTAPSAKSTPTPPTERTEVFNIKGRSRSDILAMVMKLTKAKKVEPTEEEINQMRELSEMRIRGAKDSALMQKVKLRRKKEKERQAMMRGGMIEATPQS